MRGQRRRFLGWTGAQVRGEEPLQLLKMGERGVSLSGADEQADELVVCLLPERVSGEGAPHPPGSLKRIAGPLPMTVERAHRPVKCLLQPLLLSDDPIVRVPRQQGAPVRFNFLGQAVDAAGIFAARPGQLQRRLKLG